MSVKATVKKPTATPPAQTVDLDNPESVNQFADSLGIEPVSGVGTGGAVALLDTPQQPRAQSMSVRPHAPLGFVAETGGAVEGEFDMGDVKVPRLTIVNGSGELAQKYNQGTLLFSDEPLWNPPSLVAGAKNPVLHFVPVRIKKQWRENLTQDEVQEGNMPRIVSTREAAEELGGSTQWIGGEKPRWSPSGACLFLIAEPEQQDRAGYEDRHPGFVYSLDGRQWALGMYYAGGTAYNESVKPIISTAFTVLKENGKTLLHKRVWTWQVVKKKAGNFGVFVPSLRLSREDTGTEVRDFIRSLGGSGQEAA